MGRRFVLRDRNGQTAASIQHYDASSGAAPPEQTAAAVPAEAARRPVHAGCEPVACPPPGGTPASADRQSGNELPARGPAAGLSAAATCEFESLFRRYETQLLTYAGHLIPRGLRSGVDPQDIVQEAFLSAFLSWGHFDRGRAAPHWLMAVARNRIRNLVHAQVAAKRGGKRATAARTPAEADEAAAELDLQEAPGPTPDESASRHEAAESVQRLICGLPPDRQQAIRLHFMDGLGIAAVAEELGRSEGSVLMLCNRAIKDMREQLFPGP
jgi:RNA polymerase sigma-70 factor (ECF subfamily)